MSSNLSSLEATNAVKTEIRLKFKATPAPWGSGSGSDLVEGSLSGSPSIEFDPCSYPGSDSDSGSDSASGSGSDSGSGSGFRSLLGGTIGAGRLEISGILTSVAKITFPKSTENFLHQTESHFSSETFKCSGRIRVTASLEAAPRIGASSFLYA